MSGLWQPPSRLVFDRFEVRVASGELLKDGIRIKLPPQPFGILVALLKAPGELVSREELRLQLWNDGTFVDFEHGLNAAMNKLRRALGDSADNPRYIETIPGRGYRFIGNVSSNSVLPAVASGNGEKPSATQKQAMPLWFYVGLAACLLTAAIMFWRFHKAPATPEWKLTRITNDSRFASAPALSRDAKLVAYSSNPDIDGGGQDLFVRQVAGGQPIRLTFGGEENTSPDFSPDGNTIVFRSNRIHSGIYAIPSLGGEARLLAADGLDPKYSPDGSQIAFWSGTESVAIAVPGSSATWTIPASGGQPKRMAASLTAARTPIWAPNGKWLLVVGYDSKQLFDVNGVDWWLVPMQEGLPRKTGLREALQRSELLSQNPAATPVGRIPVPNVPAPRCWLPDGRVIFTIRNGDARNLWEVMLSPEDGKLQGMPRRLTIGSGSEEDVSCSPDGVIAFSNLHVARGIWSLPLAQPGSKTQSALETLMQGPGNHEGPSVSRDGRHIAVSSDQSGVWNIWLKDLETGEERKVAPSPLVQRYPLISPSGTRVVYSLYEKGKRSLQLATPGEQPVNVCDGCLRATDWSRDESRLLVHGGSPYQISFLDIASRRQTPLIMSPAYSVLYARFSPDERWVSFTARVQPGRARIMIARIDGPRPVPEKDWISITETDGDDYANWSPDGDVLYFTSKKDGHSCLWAQRLAPASGQLVGEAYPVQHFHGRLLFDHGGWFIAKNRVALALAEATGDIWLMSRSTTP